MRLEHPQKVLEMRPMRRYGVALVARSRQRAWPSQAIVRRGAVSSPLATQLTGRIAIRGRQRPAGSAQAALGLTFPENETS
jgi:hypothetical protein